jgi:arylsulfatase A
MKNYILLLILFFVINIGCNIKPEEKKPNFIIIFCDDLGYGDVGWLGPVKNRTPNIDAMAKEGVCFTDFYCTSGVCSPSRSSLMTGCYPLRVGIHKSSKGMFVLVPIDKKGLNPDELTIAEVLKPQGYKSACIGKWHLGDQPDFLPTRQGFDYYYGLPYSNDMGNRPGSKNPLPLMRNEEVIEAPADQTTLTQRYTQEAVQFIRNNKDNPFFLYLPHTMPHVPIFSSEAFHGKSKNGKYGDAVEEIDWSTGEIMKTLKELGIDDNTLVIFTSDNGATRQGSNGPLSGGKATYKEGGMRMPCVMRWPGKIEAGTICDGLSSTMDLLPTFADLAGAKMPVDRIIDGKNIRNLMEDPTNAESPRDVFYYYFMSQLSAVRSGKWKLWLPLEPKLETWMGKPTGKIEAALYNLETDVAEKVNVIADYPEVVEKLMALAQKGREDIGDYQLKGSGQRDAGWVEEAKPLNQ